MIRKCTTAEDMRRLEVEINYFYTHGGPVMDNGIPSCTECAMTETSKPQVRSQAAPKVACAREIVSDNTKWRQVVRGGLEAEIAYFYEHGGPVMD